jgi:hypothetical protein
MSTGNLVGAGDGGQYISDAVMAVSYPFASIDGSWSPVNESTLSAMDWDLASSGVVVLPNNAVLVGGKQGYLYVIDQTTMQCVPPDYLAPPGCATLNPPYSSLDPCGLPLSVDSDGCPILSQPTKSYPFPGVVGAPAVYTSRPRVSFPVGRRQKLTIPTPLRSPLRRIPRALQASYGSSTMPPPGSV